MTKRANAMMTMKQAMEDFNNTVEMIEVDGYVLYMNEWDYSKFLKDYEREQEIRKRIEWENETVEWLRNHSNNPADPNYSEIYSDVYKDLFGIRPRW